MEKAKVYFTKNIDSESLVKMYEVLNKELKGNVGVKMSTGEAGNNNYLHPELIKDLVHKVNGTIIECNTAYDGKRTNNKDHLAVIKEHGFLDVANVDLMDSEGNIELPVNGGKHLKVNYVGKNLLNYDSILMLSHFKGHPMGGFGGALKNMSIGIASRRGKAWIHSAGKIEDANILWENLPQQDDFIESMAEADKAVVDKYKNNIVYINVINNLSVDCDCVANPEKVCMKDIGIVSSLDPIAIDKACLDLIYSSEDEGKKDLIERIESRNGVYTIKCAYDLGIGNREYELIKLD